MPLDRPISAFYCCYLLRSTVKSGSVYVGSTPNPVRRLRQHNGLSKGGAVRTSRQSLRPWEMTCIVTGFPSHIAALKFEWAWQNPHITLHIPPESRLQHAVGKKRSGHPKRPRHSVTSLLSNLHLLLRVPSFARWPLKLHFFAPDVHKTWLKWNKTTTQVIRDSVVVVTDFPTEEVGDSEEDESAEEGGSGKKRKRNEEHGIDKLVVDYTDIRSTVAKAKDITDFEREGSCAICTVELIHDEGVYAICPEPGCESVTHLKCLSAHFLKGEGRDVLVPIEGTCPSCKAELRWVDVVKELSLRIRGQKEVEKLLKVKRARKGKDAVTASQIANELHEVEDGFLGEEEMEMDEEVFLRDLDRRKKSAEFGDSWDVADGLSDSDLESVASMVSNTSTASPKGKRKAQAKEKGAKKGKKAAELATVIEDSDWDDAEILD